MARMRKSWNTTTRHKNCESTFLWPFSAFWEPALLTLRAFGPLRRLRSLGTLWSFGALWSWKIDATTKWDNLQLQNFGSHCKAYCSSHQSFLGASITHPSCFWGPS